MGKLIKEWVKSILTESIDKCVVVYGGRFQPFHAGHYATYKTLIDRFGKDNVHIGTSNKTDNLKSPFNFNEKKKIMVEMFNIPPSKITQTNNPYSPKEIISNFDANNTAFVAVVGEKDRYRLRGNYFKPYHPDKVQMGYANHGYVYVAPALSELSGTSVRKSLSIGNESKRKSEFKRIYGQFNPSIFNLISGRLYEIESTMESFLRTFDMNALIAEAGIYNADAGEPEEGYLPPGDVRVIGKNSANGRGEPWFEKLKYTQLHFPVADNMYPSDVDDATEGLHAILKSVYKVYDEIPESEDFITIKEASSNGSLGKSMVDDGPGFLFGDFKSYKAVNDEMALKLGFQVIDYILNPNEDDIYADDERMIDDGYPVSFFPSGINGIDAKSYKSIIDSPNYKTWKRHIDVVATQVGYTLVEFLKKKASSESLILEGGAYGHMSHPFEASARLTIDDLKNIIKGALSGNLQLTREKTDGLALAISWRDDMGLIAARNKSHLRNRGENALDIGGIAFKFKNRGVISDAYNFAMVDLNNAIKSLSKSQRDSIFKQGKSFMNLEVIHPKSVNVIPYGQPLLIFHGIRHYDKNGNVIGENQKAASKLARMVKQINKNVQKNYTIQGPPMVKLPKSNKLMSKQPKYISMLNALQREFDLNDIDVISNLPKQNQRKFEDIFLALGADVLSCMNSTLTINQKDATKSMINRLDHVIDVISKSGDLKKIDKLNLEMQRLGVAGGKQMIVPCEGIVFVYNGRTYKLTGTFAPLNQILRLMQ